MKIECIEELFCPLAPGGKCKGSTCVFCNDEGAGGSSDYWCNLTAMAQYGAGILELVYARMMEEM